MLPCMLYRGVEELLGNGEGFVVVQEKADRRRSRCHRALPHRFTRWRLRRRYFVAGFCAPPSVW